MNFIHDKRHKKEKGKSFLLKRRSAEPVGVISFLHSYPLSLATLDSSPKGTPYGNAGNFVATAKSRPLGEGGIAAGDDGRGIPRRATVSAGNQRDSCRFPLRPTPHEKGVLKSPQAFQNPKNFK